CMDNLCHTLVGAALGEAGLKRRTAWGNATLMIAANLPDLDVLVFATDAPSIAFRRGWTHGVLAQLLLPLALTAIVAQLAKRRGIRVRVGWLLALSYIGVYSHVLLDLLNTYGVRLLAPVAWRWFYGDSLFIVDPWMWLMLGAGVWLARRRSAARPARVALAAALVYVLAMVASARLARTVVLDAWQQTHDGPPVALMVGPEPVTPLRKAIIVDAGDHYETGSLAWLPTRVRFDPTAVRKNADHPEVAQARDDRAVRAFLVWSRFPFWTIQRGGDRALVTVRDMRFM